MAAVISGICFGSVIGALLGLKIAAGISNEDKRTMIFGTAVGALYCAIGGGFFGAMLT